MLHHFPGLRWGLGFGSVSGFSVRCSFLGLGDFRKVGSPLLVGITLHRKIALGGDCRSGVSRNSQDGAQIYTIAGETVRKQRLGFFGMEKGGKGRDQGGG